MTLVSKKIKSAQLKIYIYVDNAKPSDPQYTLKKTKISSEDSVVFEISELVKDYIQIGYDVFNNPTDQATYVDLELERTFDDDTTSTENINAIAFKGWGYQEEGVNPELSKDVLISNRTIIHSDRYPLRIPFYQEGDFKIAKVEYLNASDEVVETIKTTGTSQRLTADTERIRADYAFDLVKADTTHLTNEDANSIIGTDSVSGDITKIKYTRANGSIGELTVVRTPECKYEPYRVTFANKFGVLQDIFFFKVRKDSTNIERTSYKKSILTVNADGASFNTKTPQSNILNSNGQGTFRMNTGFLPEDYNKVITELLLTEDCWITEDGDIKPVIPRTSTFEEKNSVNEKLINFEVEFEYANGVIQSVR